MKRQDWHGASGLWIKFDLIFRPKGNVDKIIDVKILCNRWSESGAKTFFNSLLNHLVNKTMAAAVKEKWVGIKT